MITPQMLGQLNFTFGQVIAATRELSRTMQQAQPQTWTMEMLRARWPGFSDEAIVAILEVRLGYQGRPGLRLVLSLDEVLAVDEEIRKRLAAQRLPPAQRKRVA